MRLGLAVVSFGSFVVMLAMAGCGQQGSGDRPATVPVTAVVNYNGSPVSGATVSYIADGGEDSSSGITDSSGRAAMGTFGDGDGVVPGKYKITISKVTIVGGDVAQNVTVESPDSDLPPVPVQKRQELPAKYSSPDTSGLTAEVSESGPNDATFDLTG